MTARALILLLTLTAAVAAQGATRAKVFGMVRQADGQPRSGAAVHLLARPLPDDERFGEPDSIETLTDGRGRFRAQILEGRPYSAWAVTPNPDGGSWVTGVQEDVSPSIPVILGETTATPAVVLQFAGLERWAKYRPMRCLVVSDSTNVLVVELEVDAQGRATMPPWPGERLELALLGKGDFPIVLAEIDVPRGDRYEIVVPAPKEYQFAVYDIDTGKGLAGARVCRTWRNRLLTLGESGADGVASLELPWAKSIPAHIGAHAAIIVAADGYTWAGGQHGPGELTKTNPLREGLSIDWHAHLGPETVREGRLWLTRDVPAANLPLLVEGTTVHYHKKNSRHVSAYRTLHHTDADGVFRIPHTWNEFSTLITPVLQSAHIGRLPAAWRPRMYPAVPAAYYMKDGEKAGELRLDQLQPVDVHFVGANGLDAPGVSCVLHTEVDNMLARQLRLTADRRGRLRLLLRPGRVYPLFAQSGGLFGRAQIRLAAGKASHRVAPLTMVLGPGITLRGRLLDPTGKGLAGVQLTCHPIADDELDSDEAESEEAPPQRVRIEKLGLGERGHMLRRIAKKQPDPVYVTTLEDGRFSVDISRTSTGVKVTAKAKYQLDITISADDMAKAEVLLTTK